MKTRSGSIAFAAFLSGMLACTSAAHAGFLGADVNADVDAFGRDQMSIAGFSAFGQNNTVYAAPMWNQPPGDHAAYWNNMVEQYEAAQLDFVAVWLKGNDQPATFANCVAAIKRRELSHRLKIMAFDDNPASWTAVWNFDHGRGYGYAQPFDLKDSINWVYVWDKDVKPFFQAVPDANRFKINGRPVYAIWSGSPAFVANLSGNGSKLIQYLRQQCQTTFGFNPYIMVPKDWIVNDPSSDSPSVVDGVYPWFTPVPGPNYSSWNTNTWNGATFGCVVPQFHISNNTDPNQKVWGVDPDHGKTLVAGLKNTVGKSDVVSTFIEGFDDYWENTTLWRARNVSESGAALGYAQTYYDYPNQRINLVRSQGNNPFPSDLKVEAEGADFVTGGVPSPAKTYRNGNISVETTTDRFGGWNVCSTRAGQVLEWLDIPLQGTMRLKVRAATAGPGRKLHFVIDGVTHRSMSVPLTGGGQTWTTIDMGRYSFAPKSVHRVRLVWDTGGVNVNWWGIETPRHVGGGSR